MAKKIELLIVTGMSGAGKSVVLNSLEDLGYHCIDNLPPKLLPALTNLILDTTDQLVKLAVVIDLRSLSFDSIDEAHHFLQDSHLINVRVLYLEADTPTLVKRFKEVRRSHPFARTSNLAEGIAKERKMLQPIYDLATLKINTSGLSARKLREEITKQFSTETSLPFAVTFMSFGFKHSLPIDTDLMFDVRFLPNPFYIEELKPKTGLDIDVYDYVLSTETAQAFLEKLIDLLEFLIPNYEKEGKSQVVIGIGCTGGQHRSVAISEYLGKYFDKKYQTSIVHQNVGLANKRGGE